MYLSIEIYLICVIVIIVMNNLYRNTQKIRKGANNEAGE